MVISFALVTGVVLLGTLPGLSSAQFGGPCLIDGPDFPAPTNPSQNLIVQAAVAALGKAIDAAFQGNATYGTLDSANSTFSIDVYSAPEPDSRSLYTYHHTGAVMQQDIFGVTKVDSNTVYAIGSISKLLTTYLYLIEAGDASWGNPVTKYIPELATLAKRHKRTELNQMEHVDWDEITVGALASHLAGIGRYIPQNYWYSQAIMQPGWPQPDGMEQDLCGITGYYNAACNRTQFFEVFTKRPPVVAPYATPIYSNSAFTIFGYVLEAITSTSLEALFNRTLVARMSLNATTFSYPSTTNGSIIPISPSFARWNVNLLTSAAAGGYYSSINDLKIIGRSILQSSHLTQSLTRRWFKPHSFTSDPRSAIGAPWEIIRAPSKQRVTWVYTKSGDVGAYNSLVGFVPEYNVGFTILTTWSNPAVGGLDRGVLGNMVLSIMYPALEAAAKAEAATKYAGTYIDTSTNSTIVISTDEYSGLALKTWTTNGSDVRARFLQLRRYNQTTAFTRLIPTGLTNRDKVTGRTTAIGFKLLASEVLQDVDTQTVTGLCYNWGQVDGRTYGYQGPDAFVFDMGKDGTAKRIRPRAFETQRLVKSLA